MMFLEDLETSRLCKNLRSPCHMQNDDDDFFASFEPVIMFMFQSLRTHSSRAGDCSTVTFCPHAPDIYLTACHPWLNTEFQCIVEWLLSWLRDPLSSHSPLWLSPWLSAHLQAGMQRGDNLVPCSSWSPSKDWVEKVFILPCLQLFCSLVPWGRSILRTFPGCVPRLATPWLKSQREESEVRVGFTPGHRESFRRLIGICKWRLRTRQTTQQVITAKLT